MSYLDLPAGFAPFIHVANFTMTTTTTTTTVLAGPIAAAAAMAAKKPKSTGSMPATESMRPVPAPIAAPTTPSSTRSVYAGHKRPLPNTFAASERKRQRRNGVFRPRKHPRARVTGPRTTAFTAEPRYDVADPCVLGKRRGRICEERGLKARVLKYGRLHFVCVGEEETGFEEQLRRVEQMARVKQVQLDKSAAEKEADMRTLFELDIREADSVASKVAVPNVEAPTVEPVPEKVKEQPVPTPTATLAPSSPSDSVHDDCPTDDEDSSALPSKAKSVLGKIGSLKSFKNAVAKASSRVLKWKERKEKKEEEKRAASEGKKKRKTKKAKKEVESEGTEEDVKAKKERSLRSRLKSKKEKSTRKNSTASEDSEDTDVKLKGPSRSANAVREDDSGDETEIEKPRKKSVSEVEKKEKKKVEREEEEKEKKRLSITSVMTVTSSNGEESQSSAASIQDVDMLSYAASLAETKSILEEMDIDDAATIRGGGGDGEGNGERSNADDDASRQLQSEASIGDDASDAAAIREKPESKSDRNADEETQGSGSSIRTVKRAILAVMSPPVDMLTPPPTPPLGSSPTKTGDSNSHWISYKATGCQADNMSDSNQTVWKETWSSGKKSLQRRLSAIFKKTLEDSQMDQFNPLNISRHAYRDSWCRDDDDDTECDANSILTLTVPSPPEHMDYCAWDTDAYEMTPIDSCRERVESFNIAF